MPKNEFYKTYAVFSTKYGSRDTEFIPIGERDYIKTPEGIAHFLEHKLFEQPDGSDASNKFAELEQMLMLLLQIVKLHIYFQQRQMLIVVLNYYLILFKALVLIAQELIKNEVSLNKNYLCI